MEKNGNSYARREDFRNITITVVTALIISFVATSINDYLEFKESDAIHSLRLDSLKKRSQENLANMRRELEQLRVQVDTHNIFTRTMILEAIESDKETQRMIGDIAGRLKNMETTIFIYQKKELKSNVER